MAERLTQHQKLLRLGLLGVLVLLPGYFFVMQTLGLPSAPPCTFRSLFGLPCLMCGGTRAIYALLQGRWSDAWYFNPLASVLAPVVIVLCFVIIIELLSGRSILAPRFKAVGTPLKSPLAISGIVVVLVSLWAWHVHSALTCPKPELLGPQMLRLPITPPGDP